MAMEAEMVRLTVQKASYHGPEIRDSFCKIYGRKNDGHRYFMSIIFLTSVN
jgi:hypothetical protein